MNEANAKRPCLEDFKWPPDACDGECLHHERGGTWCDCKNGYLNPLYEMTLTRYDLVREYAPGEAYGCVARMRGMDGRVRFEWWYYDVYGAYEHHMDLTVDGAKDECDAVFERSSHLYRFIRPSEWAVCP